MGIKLPRGVATVAVACAALALLPGCAQKGSPVEPDDPVNGLGGYRIVGSLSFGGYAEDLEVSGDLCLIAASQGGLVLADVSDPASPSFLSRAETPYPVAGCSYIAGDSLAFAAIGTPGVSVYDVSDVLNPIYQSNGQGGFSRDVVTREVALGDHHEVFAADGYGMKTQECYWYENQGKWFFRQATDAGGLGVARGICLHGNLVLLAKEEMGLWVYDVTDVTSVLFLGTVDTPGEARAVAASGNYAYVADWRAGLQVVDMSDPANPAIVGSAETDGMADGVACHDGKVFVAVHNDGMVVFDVSDPTEPVAVGHLETPYANEVFVTDDYVYIADRDWGLVIAEEE
jgi:hypothetical protein